ncbi:MAG: SpoIVB peptidase [Clostridiales bacterium]|nr:SpoIVB peptidase [Clostridiales bacterium]
MGKRKSRLKIFCGIVMMIVTAWMIFSPTSQAIRSLPEIYRLAVGESCQFNTGIAVLSSQDERLLSADVHSLAAVETGQAEVTLSLFGLFPVRRMQVDIEQEKRLVPGGQAVGVALATQGVLVIGVSDVSGRSPAQAAGLKAGDVIHSIDGESVTDSEHLTRLVTAAQGKEMRLTFQRDGQERTAVLTPQMDTSSGLWRIGAWVRDSTAGVGTLSFYDPETGNYGALGHAINDGDTGKLLPVRMGALMKAQIVDIRRGQKGTPGELRGSFLRDQVVLGDIEKNTQLGIYGHMDQPHTNPLYPNGLPVGYQESVQIGPAVILSTLDENGVRAYEVEIVQKTNQPRPAQKSMVIRVTDPDLLERTGGIVQGMSGSPIIQNGKIIGAVTHVFVDDPTMGYGIFIENMLNQMGNPAE